MVVDVGVAIPLHGGDTLLDANVRRGTRDLTVEPAMTVDEARAALEVGISVAGALVDQGAKCLLTGDMGIANTTPAAALIAAFTGAGPGGGDRPGHRDRRRDARPQDRGRRRRRWPGTRPTRADPLAALAAVGGLEHAALAGFILGAAERRVPVIIDGVIAALGRRWSPPRSPPTRWPRWSPGTARSSRAPPWRWRTWASTPLLDLGMRLGEGTGAVLALPIVAGAVRVLHDVATFDSAGVSEK